MSNTNTDFILKKQIASLTLKWCKSNLGINEKKKRPVKLCIRIKPQKEGKYIVFGHYFSDINSIYVYGMRTISIRDIVATIIHEYTHYLQSDKKYWEYFKTHYYSTHPYERQARRNEERYTNNCLNDITKLLN